MALFTCSKALSLTEMPKTELRAAKFRSAACADGTISVRDFIIVFASATCIDDAGAPAAAGCASGEVGAVAGAAGAVAGIGAGALITGVVMIGASAVIVIASCTSARRGCATMTPPVASATLDVVCSTGSGGAGAGIASSNARCNTMCSAIDGGGTTLATGPGATGGTFGAITGCRRG